MCPADAFGSSNDQGLQQRSFIHDSAAVTTIMPLRVSDICKAAKG
jgi:hypothetical protein